MFNYADTRLSLAGKDRLGREGCCHSGIVESGRLCEITGPPCLLRIDVERSVPQRLVDFDDDVQAAHKDAKHDIF